MSSKTSHSAKDKGQGSLCMLEEMMRHTLDKGDKSKSKYLVCKCSCCGDKFKVQFLLFKCSGCDSELEYEVGAESGGLDEGCPYCGFCPGCGYRAWCLVHGGCGSECIHLHINASTS